MKIHIFLLSAIVFLLAGCENDEVDLDDTNLAQAISMQWTCLEDDGEITRTYGIEIVQDGSDPAKVWIHNFHMLGDNMKVFALIDGSTIVLPVQEVSNYAFIGQGNILNNGTKINFNYTAEGANESVEINASYSPGTISKKLAKN